MAGGTATAPCVVRHIFEIGTAAMGINASSTCTATLITPSWPVLAIVCMFLACVHPSTLSRHSHTHPFSHLFLCSLHLLPFPPSSLCCPNSIPSHRLPRSGHCHHTLPPSHGSLPHPTNPWVCFIPETPNAIGALDCAPPLCSHLSTPSIALRLLLHRPPPLFALLHSSSHIPGTRPPRPYTCPFAPHTLAFPPLPPLPPPPPPPPPLPLLASAPRSIALHGGKDVGVADPRPR